MIDDKLQNKMFEIIIDQLPVAIQIYDKDGFLIKANDAWAKIWNISNLDSLIGKYNILNDKYFQKLDAFNEFKKVFLGHEINLNEVEFNYKVIKYLDKTHYLNIKAYSVKDSEGNVHSVVVFDEDVTDKKYAEKSLVESKNYLKTLFNAMSDIILEIDADGKYLYIAPTAPELLYRSAETIVGKNLFEVFDKKQAEMFLELVHKCLKDNKIQIADYSLIIDNKVVWFECRITKKTENSVLYIARDITKRKKVEEQLKEKNNQLQLIMEGANIGWWDWNISSGEEITNRIFPKLLGYEKKEMSGSIDWWINKIHSEDKEKVDLDLKNHFDGNTEFYENQHRLKCKDGEWKWFVDHGKVVERDKNNNPIRMVGTLRDIDKEVRAKEKLKESEEYFRVLLENNEDIISVIDDKGINLYQSKPVGKLLGYEDAERIGKNAFEFMHPEDLKRTILQFTDSVSEFGLVKPIDFRVFNKDGSLRYFEGTAKNMLNSTLVSGIVVNYRDVTKRIEGENETKKLQEQLNQSRKMDAIGQLAGGIAHDFNNMLTGIMGAAQLLKLPTRNLDEKGNEFVDMILKASNRAADLTNKLLAYSRKSMNSFASIDIRDVVDDTISIIENTIDKKIDIFVNKHVENSVVMADKSDLQNAFINICINASHAMPNGGELRIKIQNIELNEIFCENSPFEIMPGRYIDIQIEDTGFGIEKDEIKKIFEPFYTTKDQGKGTGLGLSAVYGIVQDHHGLINVYSEVGIGSSFHIMLPCWNQKLEESKVDTKIMAGTGKVLLVDDEEFIRITGLYMLEEMGYDVIIAKNGTEAVELFEKNYLDIDIVLMDMIMPKMNGSEAFIKMKKIDENCKVVISSGFTKNESLNELNKLGLSGFIRKPFQDFELSKLLVKVLNKKL